MDSSLRGFKVLHTRSKLVVTHRMRRGGTRMLYETHDSDEAKRGRKAVFISTNQIGPARHSMYCLACSLIH